MAILIKFSLPSLPQLRNILSCVFVLGLLQGVISPSIAISQTSSLAFTGLRSTANQGQFNSIQADAAGNLYLLLDQRDGVRVLKTDAAATTVLAQVHVGAKGDIGLGMALDPNGNVYVTGTTTSGTLTASAGAAFPTPSDNTTNSFVAKFDANLNPLFLTFAGSGKIAASSVSATANGVFITGSIFAATLPVTPSAILQSPSNGSVQNGFVEAFNTSGTSLLYATYLTGAGGDTAPAAIATDAAGDAFIVGYTTAPGYPTLVALVPDIIPSATSGASGFLTRLTPVGDGIIFSTFIPGEGLTSIALDPASQNLLLSGSVSLGQFPVATVSVPLVSTNYQVLLRMPLDGSAILASTLLAPGTQSFVAPAPGGTAWVDGQLSTPLLPSPPLSHIGNSFAEHVTAQSAVDQTARFGGLSTSKPTFASALANLTSQVINPNGEPVFAGAIQPQTSSGLLATETFDVPLYAAPTTVLPAIVRDAVPAAATCDGSLCPGSAAFLARLTNSSVPSLALSYDAAPNLTLRNLGSATANALSLTSPTFTIATTCGQTLTPGAECSIELSGTPPGVLTIQTSNANAQTITIPSFNTTTAPIVFSPKELDFGIQTASSAPRTLTITITNLSLQSHTFTSKLDSVSANLPYTIAESASDCPISGLISNKLLAAGATCHITLSLTANGSSSSTGAIVNGEWAIGSSDVLISGYAQAAALSVSSAKVDFGTQYTNGLHLPRYLYLSNSSDATITHAHISTAAASAFAVQDRCPTQLNARTVCQLQLDYTPTQTTSNDTMTLNLDQGLNVLVRGQSVSQPGTGGTSSNPNLNVSPGSINFPNAVVVTTASAETQTITIGNTGVSPFDLTLALSGDFTDATNCPAILAANATCNVVFTFTPTQPGVRQGILSVTAGQNSTPVYVNLTGTGMPILPANNGALDFGSVVVGQPIVQWYKVSQPFTSFSAMTTGSEFTAILVEDVGYGHGQPPSTAFSSSISGTCLNCWLGIQFKPATVGPRASTVTLTSTSSGTPYTLNLTGNGLPLTGLVLTPFSQDFGTVPVNSISAPALFTLTNATSNAVPVALSTPVVTGDFALSSAASGGSACAGTLAAAASCFVQVNFAPSTTGQRTGTLTIATSAGSESTALSGFGAPDPGLSLNPAALVFNIVPGLAATSQTITLTNTGSNALQIASLTVTTSNFISTTNCNTLTPGASCTINVTFIPAEETVTDTFQFAATATVSGNPVTNLFSVPLTGTYTAQVAGLQIIPAQANFGTNPTETLGQTRQFTINNLTTKSLALNIEIPRQFVLGSAPCSGLAPNASCSFNLTFLPLTNSDITGTIFAQANPTDGSATLNAHGYAEGYGAGPSTLSISGSFLPGDLLDFGQIASGQSSTRTLTLTNTGPSNGSALTIRRITSQWPFLSTTTCGDTLAITESCTITITYTPLNQLPLGTSPAPATSDASVLTIESDAVSSPEVIDLAGSAAPILESTPTNTAPLISYSLSQSSLTFGTTLAGNISARQTITLSNTGTVTIHILSFKTTPDFNASGPCTTIIPGASCDITVYFTPQAAGMRIGAIEILSDSSSSLDFISVVGMANPSLLALAPTKLDFAGVLLGTSSTLSVQATNTYTVPITFNSVFASGDYTVGIGSCPAPGAALPPATSCTLAVTFTPTRTGPRTGTLSIDSSASNLPLTVALTGIGEQGHLQIAPSTLNFGPIAVGSSANLSFILTNTGNAPINGVALTVPSGDFAITVPCNVTVLLPGLSCTVTVTFTPTVIGTQSDALTVTSSTISSPDTIPLTGDGVENGSFALTVDGESSSSKTVPSGRPATYNLTVTPMNNFTGTVVLNCTPLQPADNATCSIVPSRILVDRAPQNAVATIETVISLHLSRNSPAKMTGSSLGSMILCLLSPALFAFWKKSYRSSLATMWAMLLTVSALLTLLTTNGCGNGGDGNLRYSTPGSYQYQITASSTSGLQITPTVILNLTIGPH